METLTKIEKIVETVAWFCIGVVVGSLIVHLILFGTNFR